MLEGKPTPAGSGRASTGFRYPGDLARFVWDRWRNVHESPGGVDPLPDGAVVMSKQNELLGFGGMISGRLPDVERVWRALDLEGK
jgi:hypothetical protein